MAIWKSLLVVVCGGGTGCMRFQRNGQKALPNSGKALEPERLFNLGAMPCSSLALRGRVAHALQSNTQHSVTVTGGQRAVGFQAKAYRQPHEHLPLVTISCLATSMPAARI